MSVPRLRYHRRPGARAAALAALLLCVGLAACPGPATAPPPDPGEVRDPGAVRWTVAMRPEIDLWYHGLALTGYGEAPVLPVYQPDYAERIAEAKRAASVAATPLDRQAAELGTRFAGDPRYQALQFLPLYFPPGEALYQAIGAWVQAQGDPRRAQDPMLQQMIALLSQQFPTATQRETVGAFAQALQEEQRLFYGRYWSERQSALAGTTASVQARWDELAPRLRQFLDFMILNRGELLLSLPLGPEGRTIEGGRENNRVAVGIPAVDAPADAVWSFLHELMYPLVGTVISDQLAPAQRREIDEQALAVRTAVRAGAMLLDRTAPESAGDYRAAYLRWAGVAVPAAAAAREQAFTRAYPLPDPLPRAVQEAVDETLAGI